MGLETNHSMSTTMYCQPCCFKCAAIQSALAFTGASPTVVPYESQLFQPIGGVAANLRGAASLGEDLCPLRPAPRHAHTATIHNHPMWRPLMPKFPPRAMEPTGIAFRTSQAKARAAVRFPH